MAIEQVGTVQNSKALIVFSQKLATVRSSVGSQTIKVFFTKASNLRKSR